MSGVDGIPELAEFFLGVKDTEFQFCLEQSIFTVFSEPGPPRTGFTEESSIFWLPPRHNKQRDPPARLDICYFYHNWAFKQKTSPLDVAFSRKAASKVLTFTGFPGKRCASLRYSTWKNKLPLKNSLFSTDSEESLFGAEPSGCLLKQKQIPSNPEFRQLRTCGCFKRHF